MTYNPNIPQATDVPSQSQAQILANFTALNTVFSSDHLAFNAVDGGEHQQVTFNNVLGADPGLASPKASLYTKADGGGSSQLFFENFDIAGAANVIRQLTNLPVTQVGTTYGITTPWGQIFNWGFAGGIGSGGTDVTLALPFTPATTPQMILACLSGDNAGRNVIVNNGGHTNTSIRLRASSGGLGAYFLAIGV